MDGEPPTPALSCPKKGGGEGGRSHEAGHPPLLYHRAGGGSPRATKWGTPPSPKEGDRPSCHKEKRGGRGGVLISCIAVGLRPPTLLASLLCRDGARRVFTHQAGHRVHQARSTVRCSARRMKGASCILLRITCQADFRTVCVLFLHMWMAGLRMGFVTQGGWGGEGHESRLAHRPLETYFPKAQKATT